MGPCRTLCVGPKHFVTSIGHFKATTRSTLVSDNQCLPANLQATLTKTDCFCILVLFFCKSLSNFILRTLPRSILTTVEDMGAQLVTGASNSLQTCDICLFIPFDHVIWDTRNNQRFGRLRLRSFSRYSPPIFVFHLCYITTYIMVSLRFLCVSIYCVYIICVGLVHVFNC